MTDKEDGTKKPATEPIDDEALEKYMFFSKLLLESVKNYNINSSQTWTSLAVEELLREAVQGAARAEIIGPSGWVKTAQPKTNKRFLVNTIRNTVSSNKYYSSRSSHKSSHRSYSKSPKRDRRPETSIKKDKSKRKY